VCDSVSACGATPGTALCVGAAGAAGAACAAGTLLSFFFPLNQLGKLKLGKLKLLKNPILSIIAY
jgi:hypothetical protein